MATAEALSPPLFQPDKGLWIAPVRHPSPACAWAVRAMILDLRPDQVLIEGPADMIPLIEVICHPETRPPVAGVSLRGSPCAPLAFMRPQP